MNGFIELFAEYKVLGAFWMNIKLMVLAAIGSFVLGTILALFRISPVASFRTIGTAYITTSCCSTPASSAPDTRTSCRPW